MNFKSTDLRIGNSIAWAHEESISELTVDLKRLSDIIHYEENPDADEYARGMRWMGYCITQEMLVDMGFNHGTTVKEGEVMREGDSEYWEMYLPSSPKEFARNRMILVRWYGDDSFTYSEQNLRVAVDYVHQLQNLYHALTGQELELPSKYKGYQG